MMNLYGELLNPDLYVDNPDVARFVETLIEPEIDSASRDKLQQLSREMMPTDDIQSLVQEVVEETRESVVNTGTVPPQFTGYMDKENRVKFSCGSHIPNNPQMLRRFLLAGKALGFSRATQCVFFASMQPLMNDQPAIGESVEDLSPWGIVVVGSSLRGNCFIHLDKLTGKKELQFEELESQILREGQYDYPYSRFYHINDYEEMEGIITQISKLSSSNPLPEKECLLNFATTLKALSVLGYSQA